MRSEPWIRVAPAVSAAAEVERLDRLRGAARGVAAAGCDRLWLSAPGEWAAGNDVLRLAVAVALHCDRLRVVAAGLPSGGGIRLAEDVATADGLCAGRLEVAFDAPPDDDALERLRLAWSGAPVAAGVDGGGAGLRVEIHPRPVRPDGPPLWAEAPTPPDAARLAELELGAVVADVESARAHAEATRGPALPVALVEPSPEALRELAGPLGVRRAVALSRLPID